MPIRYTRVGWQDAPSTDTPIDAANLNHMDNGILALSEEMDTELDSIRNEFNSFEQDTSSQVRSMQSQVTSIQSGLPTMVGEQIDTKFGDSIGDEVASWLNEHVDPVGSAVVVDDTLSIQGAAADAKKAGDEISDLKDGLSALSVTGEELYTYEDYNLALLSRGRFDNDAYNPQTQAVNDYKYRISARKAISFPYDATLNIQSGFRFYPYYYISNAWVGQGWKTGTFAITANTQFYAQIARSTEDTSETADIAVFLKAVKVSGNPISADIAELKEKQSLYGNAFEFDCNGISKVAVEQGSYGIISGKIDKSSSYNIRLRSDKIYKVSTGTKVIFRGYNVQAYVFEISDLYNVSILGTSGWMANDSTKVESVYTVSHNCYLYVNYRFADNSNINPNDYNNNGNYTYLTHDFPYNIPEKAVHVYQFGGEGNNYCFVRTPSGYDPKRDRPYPFVICNHGNGWVMDGTINYANWTKRTMYVPTDDPDYIANPTEYNGTSDSSLWYSNPTIEALLTAGYIVCGCENYGDNLFGNNDCRNACADFFYHMVTHYNVEKRCYMIGASNGAMTSLNTAYLLQGAVKAMILQYPLTCLVNQYESYSAHRAAIRAAYGITDTDITEAELTKAVATHDPLTVDVVSGQKVGVFPPTKLYYSPNDAIVNYQQNALALATMLDNSNKVVEKVQCSGGHGDHSHFAPSDYVAWFDAN